MMTFQFGTQDISAVQTIVWDMNLSFLYNTHHDWNAKTTVLRIHSDIDGINFLHRLKEANVAFVISTAENPIVFDSFDDFNEVAVG